MTKPIDREWIAGADGKGDYRSWKVSNAAKRAGLTVADFPQFPDRRGPAYDIARTAHEEWVLLTNAFKKKHRKAPTKAQMNSLFDTAQFRVNDRHGLYEDGSPQTPDKDTFLTNVVKTAGRGIHSATHLVSAGAGIISDGIGKIPIVGPGLSAAYGLSIGNSLKLADSIASGNRIDKAIFNNLKENISSAKTVAPYVQSVISFVPGVGQAGALVSGVIGASIALANGRNISDEIAKAVKSAIPGGAIADAMYKTGVGVMHGDRVDTIALSALPIPDSAKSAVASGLEITNKLAKGERVSSVFLDTALSKLPPTVQKGIGIARGKGGNIAELVADASLKALPVVERKALVVGMVVGHAKKLQTGIKTAMTSPIVQGKIANYGKILAKTNPVVASATKLAGAGIGGFNLGIGLAGHGGVTRKAVVTMRKSLTAADKKGFDLALATHVGMVTKVAPPRLKTPAEKAGYYATNGMRGAPVTVKTAMMENIAKNPEAKRGATLAIVQIADARSGLWHQVKKFLGIAA
jgi:hypothetical protein